MVLTQGDTELQQISSNACLSFNKQQTVQDLQTGQDLKTGHKQVIRNQTDNSSYNSSEHNKELKLKKKKKARC